jgi:hypothetical protein
MTNATIADSIGAALDYVEAALTGLPSYAETIAAAYGPGRISRGMAALLVILVTDAAADSENDPSEIIQRMRETYT